MKAADLLDVFPGSTLHRFSFPRLRPPQPFIIWGAYTYHVRQLILKSGIEDQISEHVPNRNTRPQGWVLTSDHECASRSLGFIDLNRTVGYMFSPWERTGLFVMKHAEAPVLQSWLDVLDGLYPPTLLLMPRCAEPSCGRPADTWDTKGIGWCTGPKGHDPGGFPHGPHSPGSAGSGGSHEGQTVCPTLDTPTQETLL